MAARLQLRNTMAKALTFTVISILVLFGAFAFWTAPGATRDFLVSVWDFIANILSAGWSAIQEFFRCVDGQCA